MSTNTTTGSSGGGTSAGQKIRGAAEVVHGIGENIRGKFNESADTATNTGGRHAEVDQGRVETERGMAKLTGKSYGGTGSAQAATDGPGATNVATGAGTTAPQSHYQNQSSAGPMGGAQGVGANAPAVQRGGPHDYRATGPGTGVPPGGPQRIP